MSSDPADGEMTIRELLRKGYRLGIVTSGTERRVSREIEQLGLSSTFEVVICSEHIENKKPHPEGLEKAMSLIASSRETCCYIGDAPEDVQMGRNARVFTVGVRSSYPTSKHLVSERPNILLESIGDLLIQF